MSEEELAKEDSRGNRRKRSKGFQTSEDNESAAGSCHDCASMALSIASTEKKLDKALRCIQEIESLKKKQSNLEIKNKELKESLDFANAKIATEEKKVADHSTKQAEEEKQRAIKLKSRRKNWQKKTPDVTEGKGVRGLKPARTMSRPRVHVMIVQVWHTRSHQRRRNMTRLYDTFKKLKASKRSKAIWKSKTKS